MTEITSQHYNSSKFKSKAHLIHIKTKQRCRPNLICSSAIRKAKKLISSLIKTILTSTTPQGSIPKLKCFSPTIKKLKNHPQCNTAKLHPSPDLLFFQVLPTNWSFLKSSKKYKTWRKTITPPTAIFSMISSWATLNSTPKSTMLTSSKILMTILSGRSLFPRWLNTSLQNIKILVPLFVRWLWQKGGNHLLHDSKLCWSSYRCFLVSCQEINFAEIDLLESLW